MTNKLAAQVSALNKIPIIDYLDAQGVQPVAARRGESEYRLRIGSAKTTIVVDHYANRFLDEDHRREGGLADLVCMLYVAQHSDLCADPIMYGFDKLAAEA